MAYSSIRLLTYLINGFLANFKFRSAHRFIGVSVYVVFIVAFVILEFVVFKGK